MERPPFVRRTKHSGVGHEDIGYSYVVIRRGPRPSIPDAKVGRLGEVGRRQLHLEEAKLPPVELELDDGSQQTPPPTVASALPDKMIEPHDPSPAEIGNLIRAEAYHWPRLISPPLKKSGHIIMDVCSPSGLWSSFGCSNCLISRHRQNSTYDRPKIPREAAVLRCPQVWLG
jgi:hypothetical protein